MSRVRVGLAYTMDRGMVPDGLTGSVFHVVGQAGDDLLLGRVQDPAEWEWAVHRDRCEAL